MTFCPECGTQLKDAASSAAPTPKSNLRKRSSCSGESATAKTRSAPLKLKSTANLSGFIKYLVSGLILVTLGVSAIIEITNPSLAVGRVSWP